MKIKSFYAVYMLFLSSFLFAGESQNDDTFISLTRRPTSLNRLPTNVAALTEDDIQKAGATTLADVLDLLPGVDVARSGALGSFANVKIRGVPTSNQVQIVIDDQPIGGVSIQNIDAGMIPASNIERIEVVRGGASSLYGANTIGGVIHVFTKRQGDAPYHGSLEFQRGSMDTTITNGEAGVRSGLVDAYVNGQHFITNGYIDNSEVDHHDGTGKVGFSFSNGARIGFDYGISEQVQGDPSGTSVPFEQWGGGREKTPNSRTDELEKQLERKRTEVTIPFHWGTVYTMGHHLTFNLDRRSPQPSRSENTIMGNETRLLLPYGLTLGGSFERDERTSLNQADHHITNTAGYLQEQVSVKRWTLIPAIRLDHHSIFGSEYNPRFTAVYLPTDNWKISANVARAMRAPTITDLFERFPDPDPAFTFNPNPNLKPELSWTYDVGTLIKAGQNSSLSFSGYYTKIKDRIAAIDSDGALSSFMTLTNDTLANISQAELNGLEVEWKRKAGVFTHSTYYTFQRSQGSSPTSSRFVHLRLTPTHTVYYRVICDAGDGLYLHGSFQFVSDQFENDNYLGARLSDYRLWNLGVEKKFPILIASFWIKNLTNQKYAESVTFGNPVPQPGRTYYAGLKAEFGKSSEN